MGEGPRPDSRGRRRDGLFSCAGRPGRGAEGLGTLARVPRGGAGRGAETGWGAGAGRGGKRAPPRRAGPALFLASRCLGSGGWWGRAQWLGAGKGAWRRRQDEQHQERAGAGAEPQAGPQPGGRARAVRQDPGERRGRGRAGGALSPSPHTPPRGARSGAGGRGRRCGGGRVGSRCVRSQVRPASALRAAPSAGEP